MSIEVLDHRFARPVSPQATVQRQGGAVFAEVSPGVPDGLKAR